MEDNNNEWTGSPVELLSRWADGLSRDERRKVLGDRLLNIDRQLDSTKHQMETVKENIENTRIKYENMADVVRTMDQLKYSLEEHIRAVRLSEGSFASNAAVLEYDSAKNRTNTLMTVIKALSQLERARESLQENGKDDQQKMYESLVDMQQSQDALNKVVSGAFDNEQLETEKDRFLAWQSTALVFAIQQADFDKLFLIQKTYQSLGRTNEFISIFRRVSVKSLKDINLDKSSLESLIINLYKEVQFVYTHHHAVLGQFLDDNDASTQLLEALEDGLAELDLAAPLTELISADTDPIKLVSNVEKVLARSEATTSCPATAVLRPRIQSLMSSPFKSSLTSFALARVNAIDMTSGSFRARVEALNMAITDLNQLLNDIVAYSVGLFGETGTIAVVQQPIEKCLDNFAVKLRGLDYKKDSQGRQRAVDDVSTVCGAAGHLVDCLQEFKSSVEGLAPGYSLDIKTILKWNRSVIEFVLKSSCDVVTGKMITKITQLKSAPAKDGTNLNLPMFSISPHEYATTAGQDLLQLFHKWEQFFLDDNIAHAFHIAFKKKFEGDELFKKILAEIANRVISSFVSSIGDPNTLVPELSRQFLADTVFLKDAFEDLRTGNVEQLVALETKLKGKAK